ncbi:class I SAM-dependent methyltransferase [Pseudomonas sp.]|uniref:class I SAM-dependent methyltransferase n=1 Tax=Pseudomonas sp. TaxID=306 RepID=UPI002588507A|nr:class I SAM-dependent methyltransferase [Pseudomonas sp.]
MTKLRTWLNQHPLGAPYRGLRDILRISANRRKLLEQISTNRQEMAEQNSQFHATLQRVEQEIQRCMKELSDQGSRLDRLERLEYQNVQTLKQIEPLYKSPELPFSYTQSPAPWIKNAERLLGQSLEDLAPEQRDHWFYSFYSEMAGGVGHILEQQYRVYLPLLPKIPNARVLDIGCGAGEFLNFLKTHDVPAIGIDLDAHEVERANERGLTAVHAEATEYLAHCDERFAAISLFQVIEHVPPTEVRPLIEACAKALAPGGALLVETINLRNPNAVNGFYTDPTHQVPLSDNYLSFVFQWNQLENVEFIYTLPEWMAGISAEDRSRCYANYTVIGFRKS